MPSNQIHSYTERSWNANYGISKLTTILIADYISQDIKFDHLLWALYFLKVYPSYDVCAVHWNVDKKTFQYWSWKTLFVLMNAIDTVS